jgi:hypothetical protein
MSPRRSSVSSKPVTVAVVTISCPPISDGRRDRPGRAAADLKQIERTAAELEPLQEPVHAVLQELRRVEEVDDELSG